MAKSKTNGTTATVKADKPATVKADDNAVTPDMFNVSIEGVGGGEKWRVAIEANDSHPTESGIQFMTTFKGDFDGISNVIEAALADLCE